LKRLIYESWFTVFRNSTINFTLFMFEGKSKGNGTFQGKKKSTFIVNIQKRN